MAAQESAAGTTNQVMRWRYGDVDDSNFAVHGRAVYLLVGLLVAVVVFVALCLYLRWACHRYTPDPEASSSPPPPPNPTSTAATTTTPPCEVQPARLAANAKLLRSVTPTDEAAPPVSYHTTCSCLA